MFHSRTGRVAAILTLLSTAALPQTGSAASYLDTAQRHVKTSHVAALADLSTFQSTQTIHTLDWRQPSLELQFDLPPSERTSEIVLTLSADPLTRVARNAPLQIQFNNGKPVPVLSNGRGFEARLPLDAAISRSHRNTIRITYPAQPGSDCVTPMDGAWSIDLADSTLRMKGRAKNRHMGFAEIDQTLSAPFLSPKTVGLIARGPDGTDMQALAAQGVALRTPDVPKFSVTTQNTDFNIVMVKRDRLFDITSDPMILNSEGARIFVPRGRPTEIIFTADTDAEIVKMLELFATRQLPNTRRPISSLGELNLQNYLSGDTQEIAGRTPLFEIAAPTHQGALGQQLYKFDVSNPSAAEGELLLRLSTADELSENSRLNVTLNGKTLGAAKLDKARKSVAFELKPGTMRARSNVLTLTPDLQTGAEFSCAKNDLFSPAFSIGDGSRLTLNKTPPAPLTELSDLTATGGLFAEAESYVVLPRQTREYQAALRVLAKLAKASGQGLTEADYTRKPNIEQDKHVLVIGPSALAKEFLNGAPKALRDAFAGQSSRGENLLQAGFERSAGLDETTLQYAAAQSGPRKISGGGVAALYGSGNGKLTGIISATPGSSFIQASRNLVQLDHWNAISGGVARWTSNSVVMAQTAQSDAGIARPEKKTDFKLPDIGFAAIDSLEIEWPTFDLPEFDWPEFTMPTVSLPKFAWPDFASKKAEAPVNSTVTEAEIKTAEVVFPKKKAPQKILDVTPQLKTVEASVVKPPASTKMGLRGPFKFADFKDRSIKGKIAEFQRETKVKWSATKRWVKAKTEAVTEFKTLEDVARATDRFQDRVKPAGRGMKSTLMDKLPGKGLVQFGDRTFSVYGLILIMAFGLVLLFMSVASPTSRLGGRH